MYVDPGSGSMLIQVILATAFGSIMLFYKKIIVILNSIKNLFK